jgi:hypothetical protein
LDANIELPGYQFVLFSPSLRKLVSFRRNLNWKDSPMSMLATVKFLIENKLPVWIFR